MQKRKPANRMVLLNNEQLVNNYFQLITKKDVEGLLDMFAEDAIVYEPFSNADRGLLGKSAIEPFLNVVVMANAGLRRTIEFIDRSKDNITALATFQRGGTIRGKFAFKFVMGDGRKIKMLTITFNGW
jgi:ketosteroid isomerase-like protein